MPWWAVGPVLVAGGLTLPFLGSSSLWSDEADTASAALRPLPDLARLLWHQDAPLGGYYLMLHGWLRVAGSSAPALRLPSALALLLAVGLTAQLGRRLAGPWCGLVAGLLLAVNPFVLGFGTDARPYTFALAAAVGASSLLLGAAPLPSSARRTCYAVVVTVGIISHTFFGLVLAAHLVGLWRSGRPLRPWLLPMTAAVLATTPLLWLAARQTAEVGYLHAPGALSLPGWFQAMAGGKGWLAVPAAVVLGVALSARSRSGGGGSDAILLTWLFVPGPVLLLLSLLHPLYLNRYVLESAPALSLLLARSLVGPHGHPHRRSVATAGAVALLTLSAATSASAQTAPFRYEDLRGAADAMLDGAAPGDGALYLPGPVRTAVAFYLTRTDPEVARPTDLLAAPAHGEDATGNFGGLALPAPAAVRSLLGVRSVWLLRYTDGSALRGTTAHAVLATLGRCYQVRLHRQFGNLQVQRFVATGRCAATAASVRLPLSTRR